MDTQPPRVSYDNLGMAPRIELAILNALQKAKKEPYELPRWAFPQLRHALAEALMSPEAEHELRRVLELAVALDEQMRSPTAAQALLELVGDEPLARVLIEDGVLKTGAIDETRRFLEQEGRAEALTAPRQDAGPKPEGMRLSQLLDPVSKAPLHNAASPRSDSGSR